MHAATEPATSAPTRLRSARRHSGNSEAAATQGAPRLGPPFRVSSGPSILRKTLSVNGELRDVWSATWSDIWSKLGRHPQAPLDLYPELYRELAEAFADELALDVLAERSNDAGLARRAFMRTKPSDFRGEQALIRFVEGAFVVLAESGGDSLANHYFQLLTRFVEKFSLRYDVRQPGHMCPTLPGIFASLSRDLKSASFGSPHLHSLVEDFEHSIRRLREDRSDTQIKTCIQKQINLIEALGRGHPGVSRTTLGGIAEQLPTWPHSEVMNALKSLWRFSRVIQGPRTLCEVYFSPQRVAIKG